MNVINTIQPLEINGLEHHVGEKRCLIIESHWNYSDRVHLKFENLDLVVSAAALRKAVDNATNHR